MSTQSAQLHAYHHWLRDRGFAHPSLRPAPPLTGLAAVQQQVSRCVACELGSGQSHRALGRGGDTASVLFIGDGPLGSDTLFTNDEQDLLLKISAALGLSENDVFLTGAVHCRMPDDQPPKRAAFDTCRSHLIGEYAALNPKAVVVLGGLAAKSLFGGHVSFPDLRGRIVDSSILGKRPHLITVHPRDLLRHPEAKRQVWTELQLIKQFLV